jgi:hypothetical protein
MQMLYFSVNHSSAGGYVKVEQFEFEQVYRASLLLIWFNFFTQDIILCLDLFFIVMRNMYQCSSIPGVLSPAAHVPRQFNDDDFLLKTTICCSSPRTKRLEAPNYSASSSVVISLVTNFTTSQSSSMLILSFAPSIRVK